ncbi:hypothetical protein FHG87_003912 [Trinorchestia longiramus]|nr:hypothetical protein FHG87_003912 [Trinorchestia longiramus]
MGKYLEKFHKLKAVQENSVRCSHCILVVVYWRQPGLQEVHYSYCIPEVHHKYLNSDAEEDKSCERSSRLVGGERMREGSRGPSLGASGQMRHIESEIVQELSRKWKCGNQVNRPEERERERERERESEGERDRERERDGEDLQRTIEMKASVEVSENLDAFFLRC